jgi:penicillin-binding protein 1A
MALPIWGLFMQKVMKDGSLGIHETDRFVAPPGIALNLDCDGSDSDAVVKAEESEEYFFE